MKHAHDLEVLEVLLQICLNRPSTQAVEVHIESGCHHDSFTNVKLIVICLIPNGTPQDRTCWVIVGCY